MAHASTAIYPRRSVFSSSATIRTMPSGSLIPHHSDLHLVVDLKLPRCSGIRAPSHTLVVAPRMESHFFACSNLAAETICDLPSDLDPKANTIRRSVFQRRKLHLNGLRDSLARKYRLRFRRSEKADESQAPFRS